MKFGQLIEYNTRNIFLEKSYTKCSRETICRPFSKKSKLSTSLKQKSYPLYSLLFIVYQVEGYQNTLKLRCRPLGFTSDKAFLKIEKRCGTSLPVSFFAWVLVEKYFSCDILLTDQISLSGCYYFVRYWALYVFQLLINHVVTSQTFKLTISF